MIHSLIISSLFDKRRLAPLHIAPQIGSRFTTIGAGAKHYNISTNEVVIVHGQNRNLQALSFLVYRSNRLLIGSAELHIDYV